MAWTIKLRRGTSSAWTDANPVLADGEAAYDKTAKALKVGDGTTAWADLDPLGNATFVSVKEAPLSPYKYGAKGDGVTDDTAAWTSTLNALPAAGGEIYAPGQFVVPAGLTLSKPVVLRGANREASKIIASTAGAHVVDVAASGCGIRDLWLVGAAGSGDGLHVDSGISRLDARQLKVSGVGGNGVNFTNGNFVIALDLVEVISAAGSGFVLTSGATSHNSITFTECYANTCGTHGFDLRSATGIQLIGCAADYATQYGYFMATARIDFDGCTAEANTVGGFDVVGSGRFMYRNCRTNSQLLPFNINGSGSAILDHCETLSTPTGNALVVSAAGTGNNRLIGGTYDRLINCNAAGVLLVDRNGAGSPEGVVVGSVGSTYRRTDGGAATSFYVKETGTGSTGWVAK